MHALDHGAVLRRHQPGRLRPGDAERMHGRIGGEPQSAGRAGRGRIDADRGAGMPALADMLLPHAAPDAGADLVAGDRGGDEFLSREAGMALRHGDERGQRDGTHVQHAVAMHVVELEALHLRAVDQRGVRRGEAQRRPPHQGGARLIERFERRAQDATPFEPGAIDCAAERIEDQQLDALAHLRRDTLIAQPRHELGDSTGVDVVGARMFGHGCFRKPRYRSPTPIQSRSRSCSRSCSRSNIRPMSSAPQ
jgi:hypothetical protein